jgi:Sortase domain
MSRRWPWLGMIAGLGLIVAAGVGSTISVGATPQVGRVPAVQAAAGTAPAVRVAPRFGTRPPTAMAGETPQRLALPSLRVDAPITPVATLPGGSLAVPGNPDVLGWWQGGARPGTGQGTVVIDGHVDTAADGPGALFNLRELRPGDPVVLNTDHGPQRYLIAAVRSYLKADLPAEVFARRGQPRLVIITCGGAFNEKTRQYADNIVAYAVPA